MTCFVVFAAGPGTRVGRVGANLHKSLLPLGQQAVLSHLFDRAPADARLIVCVGNRAQQIRDYVALAHPGRDVTFVDVPDWDQPGAGPGRTLLAARDVVGDDDVIVTSCDTLWAHDPVLWHTSRSWAAYAPMPAGTVPEHWCRLDISNDDHVVAVLDKTSDRSDVRYVYVGMAYIVARDLPQFWKGVLAGHVVNGELRDTGGLDALALGDGLSARRIDWIDTGDEVAYRRAVAQYSGYDWTKLDQATYVLPASRRVVKYMADPGAISAREVRGHELRDAVPMSVARRGCMLAYEYVEGETVYERLARDDDPEVTRRLLRWRDKHLTQRVLRPPGRIRDAVLDFYRVKTFDRITMLNETLRVQARDAVERIEFSQLVDGFEAGIPHGDLNFGNIIVTPDDAFAEFVGIDWREDFASLPWFDLRYDVAKLLAGTVVHWGNARRGDFTPWHEGERHAAVIRDYLGDSLHDVEVITALSLLNSAPLHAAPLDEILVARACAWLERLT